MSCSLSLYIYTYILIPVTHLNHSMFRKWWFPKIGVPWNHPFCLGFSMINHPGVPPWLWKPPYMPLVRFCIYSKYSIFIYILYSTSILHLFNLFYRYYRYYRDFLDLSHHFSSTSSPPRSTAWWASASAPLGQPWAAARCWCSSARGRCPPGPPSCWGCWPWAWRHRPGEGRQKKIRCVCF